MGVLLLGALLPASARAQQAPHPMLDPLVPKGHVRLEFTPNFWSWDQRYGIRTSDGSNVAEVQPLGADLTDPNGVAPFSGVTLLKESLAALTGQGDFTPRIGALSGVVTKNVTRLESGLSLGVFDWLTLGAMVPYVKTRTAIDIAFSPDSSGANLGVNPNVANAGSVTDLLSGLQDAVAAAQSNADAVCGAGAGAACTAAQDLLTRVSDFSSRLYQAYNASPFFPREGSAMADALSAGLEAINSALAGAGLAGVTSPMVFANEVVDPSTLNALMTNAAAGIQGSSLETVDGLWELGDIELTADVRLLNGEIRDSAATTPRFAWTLTGGVLVRLGTGKFDSPDVFLDVGSGDGQTDYEGHVSGALRVGRRLGLWGGFRYGKQGSVTTLRRVGPPEAILAPKVADRVVTWSPGSYTDLTLSPRLAITPELQLSVDYRRYHKGQDSYALTSDYAQDVFPVDASDLNRQSEVTLSETAMGLRYNTVASWRQGTAGTPIELGVRLIRPMSGAGGQVPKATRGQFTISIFHRIWGGPAQPAPEAPASPPTH